MALLVRCTRPRADLSFPCRDDQSSRLSTSISFPVNAPIRILFAYAIKSVLQKLGAPSSHYSHHSPIPILHLCALVCQTDNAIILSAGYSQGPKTFFRRRAAQSFGTHRATNPSGKCIQYPQYYRPGSAGRFTAKISASSGLAED